MEKKKKKKNVLTLTEKHIIDKTNPWFEMLKEYCHLSKNLYNHALYILRQHYFDFVLVNYKELYHIERHIYPYDYTNMPTAQSAQQTLRKIIGDFSSFVTLNKNYKNNPKKYSGRPKMPRYKKKDGHCTLILTNQNCKLRNNDVIDFPKTFKGFQIKTHCTKNKRFVSFQQVQIRYYRGKIYIDVLYDVKKDDKLKSNRYCGIDLGVENFAALAFNCNVKPLLIKGGKLKSINRLFNKKLAYYKSRLAKCQSKETNKHLKKDQTTSKMIATLCRKRYNRINNCYHKIAKMIVEYCLKNDVGTIIVGKNKNWKKGKERMQNFVFLSHSRFIEILEYKCEIAGLTLEVVHERYTSGTSFLDKESPTKNNYDKKQRIHRGLFKTKKNKYINADINAAYQMMKKYKKEDETGNALRVYFPRHSWYKISTDLISISMY